MSSTTFEVIVLYYDVPFRSPPSTAKLSFSEHGAYFSGGRCEKKNIAIVIYDKKITQKRNPIFFWRKLPSTLLKIMSKRAAEEQENGDVALKSGERPETASLDMEEVGEFEDEFEDEYESEDEILEAGVDGRPDAEREADERAGK